MGIALGFRGIKRSIERELGTRHVHVEHSKWHSQYRWVGRLHIEG